jgi:hypothetical protein
MLKCQLDIFYQDDHKKIFETLKNLDNKSVKISMETVRAEMMNRHPKSIDWLMSVAIADPTPSPLHAYSVLEEWNRKRKLLYAFLQGIEAIFNGDESSLIIGNDVAKKVDEATMKTSDDFTSFADLRKIYADAKPLAKISTGVPFLDAKMNGGMEEGQFILLFGDPEAGKTMLGTQILRNVARNFDCIFFPFEFSARSFFDHTKDRYNGQFNEENLKIEEESTDLFDIEAKLKLFARRGGKFALIDSQMMISNSQNRGTTEERESEKFHILSRLCVRYGLRIMLICQQAKEDTRSGIVTPAKTKAGAHYAHQIYKIEMPKVKYDENGDILKEGEREIVAYKNKQTGKFGKKAIHFDKKKLIFTGRSKPKEIPVQHENEKGEVIKEDKLLFSQDIFDTSESQNVFPDTYGG